jgi:hypothetical protein
MCFVYFMYNHIAQSDPSLYVYNVIDTPKLHHEQHQHALHNMCFIQTHSYSFILIHSPICRTSPPTRACFVSYGPPSTTLRPGRCRGRVVPPHVGVVPNLVVVGEEVVWKKLYGRSCMEEVVWKKLYGRRNCMEEIVWEKLSGSCQEQTVDSNSRSQW